MKINQQNIFLLDGIGAVSSALATGLLLPYFSEWIGLSEENLRLLALLPTVFAIYSLTCFLFVRPTRPKLLLGIISANCSYCFLASAVVLFSSELTTLGRAYFIGETLIVLVVVFIEAKVYLTESAGIRNRSLRLPIILGL